MHEHVTEWLGAYLDGELHKGRQNEIEEHLAKCALCRSELDALSRLSAELHAFTPLHPSISSERFTAQVVLQLPRQVDRTLPKAFHSVVWWSIPGFLLLAWAFLQTAGLIAIIVTMSVNAGLFGDVSLWLFPPEHHWNLLSTLLGFLGGGLSENERAFLLLAHDAEMIIEHILGPFILQVVLGLMFWGWLAGWWAQHRQKTNNYKMKGNE